ncbi:MAG: hypothetical protein PHI35_08315 [Victivallaceae bacterium]|nr:hypothetical protein [Victivallaceae bacterium]
MNAPTGWFPVGRADLATLMDSAGEGGPGTTLAVWLALLSVANSEKTTALAIHIGRVARAAGVSYRTAATALRRLASAGLVVIHTRKLEGTSANAASLYEIHATVSPCAKFAQPTADFAEGTVNHDGGILPTKNNNVSKETKQVNKREAACAARALTPDNFQERAKAANGGRLTEQQLEAFVSYWLEQNTRGKCRFQSEKFFEMPRRIATWASRERVASIPSAAPAAVKPERPIWQDCARRCRHWDSEKRWCAKFVKQEPKSCERCREF